MSNIYVVTTGNGTAYATPSVIFNTGETFDLYANADPGATLDDITAREQHGWSIAVYTQPAQTITYNADWGDVTIYVTFSGGDPPPPPPPYIPAWFIAAVAKKKKRRHLE